MIKGRIIDLNAGVYTILADGKKYEAKARGKLRSFKVDKNSKFNTGNMNKLSSKVESQNIKLSPIVGDIVEFEPSDHTNYIINVEERKNSLIRPEISNIDQILLVFSVKEPDFSSYLLDLFITNIEYHNIKPIIILTKIDKLSVEELKNLKEELSYYEKIGYKLYYVNSFDKSTVEIVKDELYHKVTILSGQTGAGKSSFINALSLGLNLQTNEISFALNRGKHTTRKITLYEAFNGLIGDTPGFSKLEIEPKLKEIKNSFIEFRNYECRFLDCDHLKSSLGCQIKDNPEIKKSRYQNYIKIYEQKMGEKK